MKNKQKRKRSASLVADMARLAEDVRAMSTELGLAMIALRAIAKMADDEDDMDARLAARIAQSALDALDLLFFAEACCCKIRVADQSREKGAG